MSLQLVLTITINLRMLPGLDIEYRAPLNYTNCRGVALTNGYRGRGSEEGKQAPDGQENIRPQKKLFAECYSYDKEE